jgi:hypothetical protein
MLSGSFIHLGRAVMSRHGVPGDAPFTEGVYLESMPGEVEEGRKVWRRDKYSTSTLGGTWLMLKRCGMSVNTLGGHTGELGEVRGGVKIKRPGRNAPRRKGDYSGDKCETVEVRERRREGRESLRVHFHTKYLRGGN